MKEKIKDIYKDKYPYYLDVLNEFLNSDIDFVLLNYIFPDDKPGDLDIMVNICDKNKIESILTLQGFEFYTIFNTNQILWNKYVKNIGFIQFHLYFGLYFMDNMFFKKIPNLIGKNYDNEFQFFVFLVESFFRSQFKMDVYNNYLKISSLSRLHDFIELYSPKSEKFIENVNLIYTKDKKKELLSVGKLGFSSFFNLATFYTKKLFSKHRRFANKDDALVFVIGVDGAGKSTLIKNICIVLSKGGFFPKVHYFGLRKSMFYFLGNLNKKNKKSQEFSNGKFERTSNLSLFKILKLFVYWIEYNFKILIKIYLIPNSAKTVFILDRSFLDIIYFHPSNIARKLFLDYSISPSKVILVTANSEVIFERNQEYSIDIIKDKINFYKEIVEDYKSLEIDTKIIDTTLDNLEKSKFDAVNFIANSKL